MADEQAPEARRPSRARTRAIRKVMAELGLSYSRAARMIDEQRAELPDDSADATWESRESDDA